MRKEITVVVPFDGRDKGKTFHLTEMSASQAEKWGIKAFLALGHSGVDIPSDLGGAGMVGIVYFGLSVLMRAQFDEVEPLLDELMACAQIVPDPGRPAIVRAIMDEDVEEPFTWTWLRGEIFELHTGFSVAAAISGGLQAAMDVLKRNLPPT